MSRHDATKWGLFVAAKDAWPRQTDDIAVTVARISLEAHIANLDKPKIKQLCFQSCRGLCRDLAGCCAGLFAGVFSNVFAKV